MISFDDVATPRTHFKPAGPVTKAFFRSKAFVRGIMGPIGSGKSTACVIEILRRAAMQEPSRDGVRYTRWAIIRNSYPELKSTTIKTWAQWCPLHYGKTNFDSPITHHVKTPQLDMEVLFLALDREEDVKKLLSLELTGAWVNEAREIQKPIIDALTGRVGRYPAKKDGGATWSGILMDTNPPDDQSFWYRLAEEETPVGWEFFQQPGGMTPEAENIPNLPKGYYQRICAGKDPEWIKVYVDGTYGYLMEGKPVFPMFRDRIHVAESPISPVPGIPLLLGADFGLTPAAVIAQKLPDGRWLILDEVVSENCGVVRFSEVLKAYVARIFPDHEVGQGWGDPAGEQRAFSDERTAFEILREYTGWRWNPAQTNEIIPRLEVVIGALNRLVDGIPGFLLSPTCKTLRKGFSGGYHYRPIKTASGAQYHDKPNKNAYSHPMDGLQALFLGAGEYQVVTKRAEKKKRNPQARVARDVDYPLFSGS